MADTAVARLRERARALMEQSPDLAREVLCVLDEEEAAAGAESLELHVVAERLLKTRMTAVAMEYFGQPWAPENEYSIWARISNDPRAWGYGSAAELEPLDWLADATGYWYDGNAPLPLAAWLPRYEQWAEGQAALVRAHTPGALQPQCGDGPLAAGPDEGGPAATR
jgi:hypothetical protein